MHQQMMDNNSYNIIMALASNLEALEAYHKYSKDGNQQLWEQLARSTEQNVRLLQQALPQAMQQGQSFAGQGGSYATGGSGQSYGTGGASGTSYGGTTGSSGNFGSTSSGSTEPR
jgi:hypothetical protein